MKILIVDDQEFKINSIKSVIEGVALVGCSIDTCYNSVDATQTLQANDYDLMILDLFLPVRNGDNPKENVGYNLLQSIIRNNLLNKPRYVIGLTSFEEIKENHSSLFKREGWQILHHSDTNNDWIETLRNMLMYIASQKTRLYKTPTMKSIVIMSALGKELIGIREYLTAHKNIIDKSTGTVYESGTYKGIEIIMAESGMGNIKSGIETERLLTNYIPDFAFFVGIGGGIKDVNIGDVVFGTKIYSIESGKDGDTFQARPNVRNSSHRLVQAAKYLCRDKEYSHEITKRFQLDNRFTSEIQLSNGPISSGEKVVTADTSTTFQRIKQHANDSTVIAMEEYGFLEVCEIRRVEAIVIRGISDQVINKSQVDSNGSQEFAIKTASAVTFKFIDTVRSLFYS